MTMMDIFGKMAEGGVAAYDTKAYTAIKGAKEQEKASLRAEKRLEAELSLKEQQIKQAKIKTALQEDAKKAQFLGQKFSQTNQDPNVAAEMYNSMGYDDEMQFDQSHFESTANGGKRQAAKPSSMAAGQTEDRLKPAGEREGALVGATGGEYRFKRGFYKVDDKGQKIKGPDGKPVFVETGKPILFNTKQEMIDATMKTTMDPKLRLAMALKDLGIDEFIQKKGVSKAATKDIDVSRHEQKTAQIKQSGEANLAVAEEQTRGKMAAAGGKTKSTDTAERMEIDDFRKGFVEDYNKLMHPDDDGTQKHPFDRKQAKKIMNLQEDEQWPDTFERLKGLSQGAQNVRLQKLAELRKLPKEYIKYLKKKLNQ